MIHRYERGLKNNLYLNRGCMKYIKKPHRVYKITLNFWRSQATIFALSVGYKKKIIFFFFKIIYMYLSFIPGQNLRQRRLDIICSDLSYWPSSDLACCDLDLTCRWSRCRSDETGAASYLPWRHPPGGARSAGKTYCLQCTTLHG